VAVAKVRFAVTVDKAVLATADAMANAAGLTRSKMVEQALRHEHLRLALHDYTRDTVPALNIAAYADNVNEANKSPSLTAFSATVRNRCDSSGFER
jgi:hypothetical protein